jgi:hypothetical protein
MEALHMCWFKRDIWKAITVVGMLLLLGLWMWLLIFGVWVPVSAAGAYEGASRLATPGTVQATPTEDATVTTLNKEKLEQEVQQLKNQNDHSTVSWFWSFGAALGTIVGALLALIGVLVTITFNAQKERKDRRDARKKQAEERFQKVVEGFGSDKEGARVAAAIMLRTFLDPDYKQFYRQAFDLTVANLRLLRTSQPPADPNIPLASISLSEALTVIFREAFPRVRDLEEGNSHSLDATKARRDLDAAGIQLDNAYLSRADLEQVQTPYASLRGATLFGAKLTNANLSGADLHRVQLTRADLSQAELIQADLTNAYLSGVKLG